MFSQPAVLEEMPPFPEKESGILAKLQKSKDVTDRTGTAIHRKQSTSQLAPVTSAGMGPGGAPVGAGMLCIYCVRLTIVQPLQPQRQQL